MRSFTQLALFGPLLVSGIAIPPHHDHHLDDEWYAEDRAVPSDSGRSVIDFELPPQDSVFGDRLSFELQVLASEAACGYGNITIDGEKLPQSTEGDVLVGEGSMYTSFDRVVAASWTFECVEDENKMDSQILKFYVNSIDGEDVENTGFSVRFVQKPSPEVIEVKLLPDFDMLDTEDVNEPSLEDDFADLEYMQAQLRELKYLIREKKSAIAARTGEYSNSISDCDSLLCVAEVISSKAKKAAGKMIGKGGDAEEDAFPHFPKHHWPRPHHGKKPGNHTCEPPKHGNHTHPPPPHHRRPHFPPICRYPPPPHNGHKRPPHPEPPFHHRPDSRPPPPPPPPPHRKFPHGRPPHPPPPPPGWPEFPPPPPPHHKPHQEPFQSLSSEEKFEYPPPLLLHKPHHRPNLLLPLSALAMTLLLLLKFLHARFSISPSASLKRQARRADRHRRRSLRRAAHTEALNAFLARFGRSALPSQDDEKSALLSENEKYTDEEGDERSMDEEIAGFKVAAKLVGELVEASGVEDLPAYEESDMGSSVIDGCRGAPGRGDYTPSEAGSASDILGDDIKK